MKIAHQGREPASGRPARGGYAGEAPHPWAAPPGGGPAGRPVGGLLSVDYYIRLEQARGPHPSRRVPGLRAGGRDRGEIGARCQDRSDVNDGPNRKRRAHMTRPGCY